MKLFACDPLVGEPRVPLPWCAAGLDSFLAELDRLQIAGAAVRWRASREASLVYGNEELLRLVSERPNLYPCLAITPDGLAPEFSAQGAVERWTAQGVRCFWADPVFENFDPLPWCSGPLYKILESKKLPLLLDYRTVPPRDLDVILTAHPRLRVIYNSVPRIGRIRTIYPLMERHPELRVCLAVSYSAALGWESLVQAFGATRFLWGMGYPEAEGGSALMALAYAKISDSDRALIGSGNFEQLLSEASL